MTTPIYVLPPLGDACRPLGLAVLIQSHRAKSLDGMDLETLLLTEVARQLRMSRIGVLMGDMPANNARRIDLGTPAADSRTL